MSSSRQAALADALNSATKTLAKTLKMVHDITDEACTISGSVEVSASEQVTIKLDIVVGGATHRIDHTGTGLVGGIIALDKFVQADKWIRAAGAACMAPTDIPN